MPSSRPPLGQLLVNAGLVDEAALKEALAAQRTDRRRLGEILVDRGVVSAQRLAQLLSFQLACPWVSLTNVVITPNLLALVPRELAVKYMVVPVHLRATASGPVLYVATADPTDEKAFAELAAVAEMRVRPMVAATNDIRAAIAAAYVISGRPTAPPPEAYPAKIAEHAAEDVAPPREKPPLPVVPSPRVATEETLDADVVSSSPAMPPPSAVPPVILVVSAPPAFVNECRKAAHGIGGHVEEADLVSVSGLAAAYLPLAIVMTEDIYGFDRHGLNGLALDCDALLVAWAEDLEARQLTPLLENALMRRASAR